MTHGGAQDAGNWEVVAQAITSRLADTRSTQMEVASRAQVSLTTLRELQHNLNSRRRRPQTLAALSEALGWPSNYLEQVLRGQDPQPHDHEATDPVLAAIVSLDAELRALRARIEEIERRLAILGR